MDFTISSYIDLLQTFQTNDYFFIFFGEDTNSDRKEVILRHDVDFSLEKALEIAELEKNLGVKSTFFILIGTQFYNPLSLRNKKIIIKIQQLGHEIGLHFDVSNYKFESLDELTEKIKIELNILSSILMKKVKTVSFHRPIDALLNKQISDQIISAYENRYFNNFSYISDSRFEWKKNPYQLIEESHKKIQCLTHPIWYCHKESNPKEIIDQFVKSQNKILMEAFDKNIRNFEDFIGGGK